MKKIKEPKKELVDNTIWTTILILFNITLMAFWFVIATRIADTENLTNNLLFMGLIIVCSLAFLIVFLIPDFIEYHLKKAKEAYNKIK